MDNTKYTPTILSFCTGYGGIERGIEQALGSTRTIAHVEIEAYAIENMVDAMEAGEMVPAPIWTNVKTFPGKEFRGKVDILTAGYPCQPFSAAGKRKGEADPRHLWPHIRKQIQTIEPILCFFENVEGHITLGLSTVLSDLEADGYKVKAGLFSAAEVGAPHQRKRVFILAYRNGTGLERFKLTGGADQTGRKEPDGSTAECCTLWPARPGQEQFEWEQPRVI